MMTRFYLDTEFIEQGHTKPVMLISVGLATDDGRSYYAELDDCDVGAANEWVKENVVPLLTGPRKSRDVIRNELIDFVGSPTDGIEFWGYFGAYDWLTFTQIFGGFLDLPRGWPQLCFDLRQEATLKGVKRLPVQLSIKHHALNDAVWHRDIHNYIRTYHGGNDAWVSDVE